MQGCYAALLHPSQLPVGKGVSTAVNSLLCQFSGLETEADDMLVRVFALYTWHLIVGSRADGMSIEAIEKNIFADQDCISCAV